MNRFFSKFHILAFFAAQLLTASFAIQAFAGSGLTPPGIIHCRQKQGTQADNSNVALGFAGGTLTNMAWDGTKLALSAGQSSGNFVSRIFDSSNCHGITPWSNFTWTSTLPFFKELPSASETVTNYSAQTANLMTGLRGLWHLNETSYNGTANEVVDSSGNNHHGRIGSGSISNSAGLFNNGAAPDSTHINITNLPNMNEVHSYQVWVKTTDATQWASLSQYRDAGSIGWVLQQDVTYGVYIRIDTSAGANQSPCYSDKTIHDGNWHHILVSFNNGTCNLYVDGVKFTGTYTRGAGWTLAGTLNIDRALLGTFDEAAMWDRTLTDTEALNLYRRGSNRVKVQLRTCTMANCADSPTWKGTDATSATYFTEINNNSNQATNLGTILTGSPNIDLSIFPSIIRDYRYFQYKLIFETDNSTYSPDIKSVGITK